MSSSASSSSAVPSAPDVIQTARGPLGITPLHHATMLLTFQGKNIFIDPSHEASFAGLPKADVIYISDIHGDHFDPVALDALKQPSTVVVAPSAVASQLSKDLTHVVVLKNGDTQTVEGVGVQAIPMYNLARGPGPGKLFHDKGRGNGYVLTFADKRLYLSGDTECVDEMKALKNIDVAFVCMNLPYTMPPSEAVTCVEAFRPKVLYPYHYRGANLAELTGPLAADKDIEVRLRNWY